MPLNRDTIASLCLIMASGGLMLASFEIREPDYGVLSPAAWPRLIIVIMGALSVIYCIQSVFGQASTKATSEAGDPRPAGLAGFLAYWRKCWRCSSSSTLPEILLLLGMLISNILLSLSLLTALGGWRPIVMHLCVALGTSGGMWMLFSYVLEVFLPRGSLTGF